jgi:co-chaperonin GroES (HSP10)
MIQAKNDHVIAKEITKIEEITEAGIIIPSTVKVEPQKYGRVISVGEDVENFNVNDLVVFHPSGGQAIILNGEIYRVLKKSEIYGTLV